MAKRISIEPRSSGTFRISATNPNPGGQCLCSPYHRGEDCVGPYLVFPRGHVVTSGRAVLPVICMGTVKAALLHVEKGGEVAQVGSGRPEDDHFDGGQPTDSTDLVALRAEYQKLPGLRCSICRAGTSSWPRRIMSPRAARPARAPAR
jgi:hypothetical protein